MTAPLISEAETCRYSPGVRLLLWSLVPAAGLAAWGLVDQVLNQIGMKPRT